MMELAFFTVCGLEVFVCVDRTTTGPFLDWKREGSALLLWLGKVHVVMERGQGAIYRSIRSHTLVLIEN